MKTWAEVPNLIDLPAEALESLFCHHVARATYEAAMNENDDVKPEQALTEAINDIPQYLSYAAESFHDVIVHHLKLLNACHVIHDGIQDLKHVKLYWTLDDEE